MSKKKNIRVCRYEKCSHESKEIDIKNEEFTVNGTMYFHKDCYKAKIKGNGKDEQTKADLQLIKTMWLENISNTVVYNQLFMALNDLLARGVSSDYLVFALNYIIKNKLNLRHPHGLKYFVDNPKIKDAYQKHLAVKNGIKKQSDFTAVDKADESPKFTINKKTTGFQSILNQKQS